MLYREIIAVCSEIHTKHINTLCGQNVELLNVKPGGTYSSHWALKGRNALFSAAIQYSLDFVEIDARDFDISLSHILRTLFRPFVTGSDESG
jgi:hypothetical protein